MTVFYRSIFSGLIVFTLFACDMDQSTTPTTIPPSTPTENSVTSESHDHDDINWFAGSVEEAFSVAKQQNKPLFFYWGAVWCPPCQEIKHTVFKHPRFISQSQLFVPVYLDGDTEQAQVVGEQFAVQGYPTMIVFNSNGEELTRIPGGIEIRRYLDVLSRSLNQGKQINQLIALAQQSPQKLSSDDLIQLAFYSWSQDNLSLSNEQTLSLLKSLAFLDREQDQLALSRLLLSYLAKQIDLNQDQLTQTEKQQVFARLQTLLANPEQVLANIDYLSFYPAEILTLLNQPQPESDQLVLQWVNSLDPQQRNPLLSKAENMGKWLAPIHFYWLQNPEATELPASLVSALEAEALAIDLSTQGEERQSVINRTGNVLRAAHMYPQAKQLITKELSISKAPYYFMSSLAEIAEETDDKEGVIEWRQKAYQAAAGKATRFQWGVEYVSAVIQYQPDNTDLIVETTLGLFDNLDRGSDVFSGRNFGRLNTLLDNIKQWKSDAREETLNQFVSQLQGLCDQTDGESKQFQQCNALLAEELGSH